MAVTKEIGMENYNVAEVVFSGVTKLGERAEFRTSAENVQISKAEFATKIGADGEVGRSQISRASISIMGIDKEWVKNITWYPSHISFIDENMKSHFYKINVEESPKKLFGGVDYKFIG